MPLGVRPKSEAMDFETLKTLGQIAGIGGLCVGMVIRALETEHEGGTSKRNIAIPASEIQRFIQTLTNAPVAG